tara:strand:- start:5281 stop:5547 length:267 start_codon:yes stop_codon:yes gene_type:complete
MRYSKTKTLMKDGVRYRGTAEYPKIEESDTDIFVITQYGDRLDTIAFDFYGDPQQWWIIAKANGLTDINIEQGSSLRVPVLRNTIKVR